MTSDAEAELRRYKLRCEVLERDNALLQGERDFAGCLADPPPSSSTGPTFEETLAKLTQERRLNTQLVEKLATVTRSQQLDKAAILEIRRELHDGALHARKALLDSLNALHSIHSEYITQKRDLAIVRRENSSLHDELQQLRDDQIERIRRCAEVQGGLREALERVSGLEESASKAEVRHAEELAASSIEVEALRVELASLQSSSRDAAKSAAEEQRLLRDTAAAAAEVVASLRGQQQDLLRSRDEALHESVSDRKQWEQEQQQLAGDKSRLEERVEQLTAQQERLFQENTSLQSTLSSVLAREGTLRAEAMHSTSDKSDLQRRLGSIREKVRVIEAEHSVELARLQAECRAAAECRDSAVLLSNQLQRANEELSLRVGDLKASSSHLVQRAEADKVIAEERAAAVEQKCSRLVGESEATKRALEGATRENASLRADVEQLLARGEEQREQTALLRGQLRRAEQQLATAAADEEERQRLALQQSSVQQLELQLLQIADEGEALKQTIRREVSGDVLINASPADTIFLTI